MGKMLWRSIFLLCILVLSITAACGGGGGSAATSGVQCPAGVTPPAGLNPDIIVSAATGSNATATGTCTAPYQTIYEAVSASQAGDVIWVAPGRYDEALGEVFPLMVPTGVTLVGDVANKGMGMTQTLIYGSGVVGSTPYAADVALSGGARISGFVLGHDWVHMGFGVYVEDANNNAATVSQNTLSNTIYGGVALVGQGNTLVENNVLNSSSYGVFQVAAIAATIQDNVFQGPALEINIGDGNSIIRRNEFRSGVQVGVQVVHGAPRIESNTFISTGYPTYGALYFMNGGGIVRGNSFTLGSGPAIRIATGNLNAPDLGTLSSDPGQNTFGGAGTVSIRHAANTSVFAVGNTWRTNPPICNSEIITSGGSGFVYWTVANRCPL